MTSVPSKITPTTTTTAPTTTTTAGVLPHIATVPGLTTTTTTTATTATTSIPTTLPTTTTTTTTTTQDVPSNPPGSIPFNTAMSTVETKVAALTLDGTSPVLSYQQRQQQQQQQQQQSIGTTGAAGGPTIPIDQHQTGAPPAIRTFYPSSLTSFMGTTAVNSGLTAVKYEVPQPSDKRHGHHHHKHQQQSQQQQQQHDYYVKQSYNSAGSASGGQSLYGSSGGGGGGAAASASGSGSGMVTCAGAAGGAGAASNVEDGIAPFVIKTYELVNDPNTQNLVSWSQEHDKQAFVVYDPVVFAESVLPRYFKHSNFCSFVRQLNIYGFHKIESTEGYCFQHEYFRCDNPQLLRHIQRKRGVASHRKNRTQQSATVSAVIGTPIGGPSPTADLSMFGGAATLTHPAGTSASAGVGASSASAAAAGGRSQISLRGPGQTYQVSSAQPIPKRNGSMNKNGGAGGGGAIMNSFGSGSSGILAAGSINGSGSVGMNVGMTLNVGPISASMPTQQMLSPLTDNDLTNGGNNNNNNNNNNSSSGGYGLYGCPQQVPPPAGSAGLAGSHLDSGIGGGLNGGIGNGGINSGLGSMNSGFFGGFNSSCHNSAVDSVHSESENNSPINPSMQLSLGLNASASSTPSMLPLTSLNGMSLTQQQQQQQQQGSSAGATTTTTTLLLQSSGATVPSLSSTAPSVSTVNLQPFQTQQIQGPSQLQGPSSSTSSSSSSSSSSGLGMMGGGGGGGGANTGSGNGGNGEFGDVMMGGEINDIYKFLTREIIKLQKQNDETQATIHQLKEVLQQSKKREEYLNSRIQDISEYLYSRNCPPPPPPPPQQQQQQQQSASSSLSGSVTMAQQHHQASSSGYLSQQSAYQPQLTATAAGSSGGLTSGPSQLHSNNTSNLSSPSLSAAGSIMNMGPGGGSNTSSASISPESTIGVTPISVNNSTILGPNNDGGIGDVKGQVIDGVYNDVLIHQPGNTMGQAYEDTEMMDPMAPQQQQQQQQPSQKTL